MAQDRRRKHPSRLAPKPNRAKPRRRKIFVFFRGPSGGPACGPADQLHDPTADQVLQAFRRMDQTWGTNIGAAVIQRHTDAEAVAAGAFMVDTASVHATLVCLRNRRLGWYFEYADNAGPGTGRLVPFDPARQRGRRVSHYYGDWVYLLRGCFVPPPVAERVVLDFFHTGLPSPAVRWVDGSELRSRIDGFERNRSPGNARKAAAAAAARRRRRS